MCNVLTILQLVQGHLSTPPQGETNRLERTTRVGQGDFFSTQTSRTTISAKSCTKSSSMRLICIKTLALVAAFFCALAGAQPGTPVSSGVELFQCGRVDQRVNLKIRRAFWVSPLSQEKFFEELGNLDSKVREAWAQANVDDETRRIYVARHGIRELIACLHANLLSGDETWRFDQCAKQKRTGPSSCEAGFLVARRDVVIFKLVTEKIYFD